MKNKNSLISVIVASLGGVGALVIFAILEERAVFSMWMNGLAAAIIYVFGMTIWQIIAHRVSRNPELDALSPALGNIMFDMAQKMDQPIFISDEISERIIWNNRSLKEAFGDDRDIRRSTVGSLFGKTASQMMNSTGEANVVVEIQNRFFLSKGYRIHSPERTFCLCILTETTEMEHLRQHISDQDLVVGYILLDNVDEMNQNEQERYRSVAARIDTLLRDWAAEANGLLKEYEKDHYLFVLARKEFNSFVETKFEILDAIREIRIGEFSQPVTLSAGFSCTSGSFADKERIAQQALDTALQRGGDQIVVRLDGETEIYGGRTKSIQKRTRVRSRVVANELISLIAKSSEVLIMGHRYADFDAFASCVGLARICFFCGVKAYIIINKNDPNIQGCLQMLAGEEEYRSVFIDAATGLDMMRTDTLVLVSDVNNVSLFESPEIVQSAENVVVVDHHRKSSDFEREPVISYIEPSASAASELVAEMLEQLMPDQGLLSSEANLLLAGILLDTKQFTKNTSSRTFSAALYLRDHGADPGKVQELFSTDLDELQREAKFHSNVVIYRDVAAIAMCEGAADNSDRVAAAKAADRLLTVTGVEASFAIIQLGDKMHISARSKGVINVQLMLEQIGGGGHFDSAATQLSTNSSEEALTILKKAIDSYLDQSEA